MARAWLHAGVRCVVAAPVRINDAATAVTLARLHAHLAAGLEPAHALVAMVAEGAAPVPLQCFGNGW
ncbi:CHAT domain-containing protein [Serinibacter arcticus]|uniref:CHAT domain-containing protein n=1 Tax=Serinibacter arcticus TaxID=1655435 RepID=UPI000D646D06|nr:CHAT domain-containing protein [Serinibacter arcticus]